MTCKTCNKPLGAATITVREMGPRGRMMPPRAVAAPQFCSRACADSFGNSVISAPTSAPPLEQPEDETEL